MSHKGQVTVLENREWEVSTPPKGFGIKLVPSKKIKDSRSVVYSTEESVHE